MALSQQISQRQSQTLSMTKELQQSLKMLQMSSQDLAGIIYSELESNPLLSEGDGEYGELIVPVEGAEDYSNAELTEIVQSRELKEENEALDYDYSQSWDDVGTGGNSGFNSSDYEFDRTLEGEKNLLEDLFEQFSLNVQDERKRIIGFNMIDMLDDAGYFTGDLREVAKNIGCDIADAEDVLQELQKLEPTGIFARDLQECLSLQLLEMGRFDPCMYTLVNNLEFLGMGKMEKLCELCNVTQEELAEMIGEIKSLNPKPALGYNIKELTPSQPDILVRKKDDETYAIEINNAVLPKVMADKTYYAEVSSGCRNKEDKKYLSSQWQSANFIIRAIEQRAETMLKTASAIIKHQNDFFKYGVKYLKPLTLAQIAEEIEMHESTISRVTSNKYMQTPRGTFELKYFFTSGVSNSSGEISSVSVKETIKELINKEDREKPLSDDAITLELKKRGIRISRRTVMKYREALDIPSSYKRKTSLFIGAN